VQEFSPADPRARRSTRSSRKSLSRGSAEASWTGKRTDAGVSKREGGGSRWVRAMDASFYSYMLVVRSDGERDSAVSRSESGTRHLGWGWDVMIFLFSLSIAPLFVQTSYCRRELVALWLEVVSGSSSGGAHRNMMLERAHFLPDCFSTSWMALSMHADMC
jgi:hypothetical protein